MDCKVCGDEYTPEDITDGICCWCIEKARFAALAVACGLTRYPDPTGERYVYNVDGSCAGKKGENTDLIDELWDALVRAKGGATDLLLGKK